MAKAKNQVATQPEENAPEAAMSFEDFLAKNPGYHPGLIASFSYEERYGSEELRKNLEPRTEGEWIKSLEEQSNRTY